MTATDLINSSFSNPETIRGNLGKYVRTHCLREQDLRVFDSISGKFVIRPVRCGRCDVCRDFYSSSWYTRMYLHSLKYEYIYFITLTYAPFDLTSVPFHVAQAAEIELAPTLPQFDSYNCKNKKVLRPCLLYKPHIQNFFKRLRKVTKADLSYFVAGEYGTKYGAPHYHAIIWSHNKLCKQDITRAWSKVYYISDEYREGFPEHPLVKPFKCQKGVTPFRFYFGRVDFNDLFANGTISGKSQSKEYNGKNCFAYVCKYLNKHSFPDYRVKLAWRSLDIPWNETIYNDWDFPYKIDLMNLMREFKSNIYDYETFKKTFAPFTLQSRNPAIGFEYVSENVERFLSGNQELPKDVRGKSLVFPPYYERKIKEYLYSLRREKQSKCSDSTVPFRPFSSRSLSVGSLPDLVQFWRQVRDFANNCPDIPDNKTFLQVLKNCSDVISSSIFAIDDCLHLYDVRERVRLVVDFTNHGFCKEKYNRSERQYMSVGFISFDDFISKYFDSDLPKYLEYWQPKLDKLESDNLKLKEYLSKIIQCNCSPTLYADLVEETINSNLARQKRYDNNKTNTFEYVDI